jgi:hypothetical protein
MFCFPENCKIVQGAAPQIGVPGAVSSTPISLKNVHKAWIVVDLNPVGGAALALTPQTDALVAFGSAAVLTNAVRIWANQNTAASDRLVEQTAAVNFTTAADANLKQVIFEIDPADLAAGEDCLRLTTGALPNTDFVAITYVLLPRFAGRVASQPSVIVD